MAAAAFLERSQMAAEHRSDEAHDGAPARRGDRNGADYSSLRHAQPLPLLFLLTLRLDGFSRFVFTSLNSHSHRCRSTVSHTSQVSLGGGSIGARLIETVRVSVCVCWRDK